MGGLVPSTDASRRPVHFPIVTVCIILTNFFAFVLEFCAAEKKESEIAVVRGEILGIMLAKSMVVPPQDRWNPNDSPTLRVITLN